MPDTPTSGKWFWKAVAPGQSGQGLIPESMAPHYRLYPKGSRAKKETIARLKCRTCGRRFARHTQEEYDACINEQMKKTKPKQEHLVYINCVICSRKFGEHTSQEYEICVDQIIENSV